MGGLGSSSLPVVPVPVIAVADPTAEAGSEPSSSAWRRGSAEGSDCGGPAGLWLETPGGFRLHGLDLASAVALLQVLR